MLEIVYCRFSEQVIAEDSVSFKLLTVIEGAIAVFDILTFIELQSVPKQGLLPIPPTNPL